jgi:hypothetical protein
MAEREDFRYLAFVQYRIVSDNFCSTCRFHHGSFRCYLLHRHDSKPVLQQVHLAVFLDRRGSMEKEKVLSDVFFVGGGRGGLRKSLPWVPH